MATEDGKMTTFSKEKLEKMIKSRFEKFEEMMKEAVSKDYEIVDLRQEAGFTSRLAIKKAHEGKRGCLIVCPGGGFMFKSWNEALPVAEFFYEKGFNVAILDYHVNPDPSDMMTYETMRMAGEDGLSAIRFLRENASTYHIDPDHIAIGGFSAGGMLSGYAATQFDEGSRPDAALILYGAFSFTSSIPVSVGGMSRQELAKASQIDNVRNITYRCPPMFVFQTHEDDPRIALNFCYELAVHGVPYELHTFEKGPHGGGLYNGEENTPDLPHTSMWKDLAVNWLIDKGF